MMADQYQEDAARTLSSNFAVPNAELDGEHYQKNVDIIHAIVGISTEAGELLDALKKTMFYGKNLDKVNLDEEIGDVLWYIAIYLNARGKSFEQVFDQNIAKLRTRYPEKFTESHALHRDVNAERATLEQSQER